MASDIDIASCTWSTEMFPLPTAKFNVNTMGTLANNSGFLCLLYETAMCGQIRLYDAGGYDSKMASKIVLEAGTYEFQCSIYSVDGIPADGTITVDGTDIIAWTADGTSPDWVTGSGTIVVASNSRVDLSYTGARDRADTEHYIWVGYRRFFQGTA